MDNRRKFNCNVDKCEHLVRHVAGCVSRTVIELSYFVFLVYAPNLVRPCLRVIFDEWL